MTRKDYVLIAEAVKETTFLADGSQDYKMALAEVAMELANALSRDNPRFDRGRFLRACGVEG